MKLKQRVGDFRVRELLRRDYMVGEGEHRVYRVTKRKVTSDEAARILAREAGVESGEVCLAGLKDRQGLTTQYMSVVRGREVRLSNGDLSIEPVGFARTSLSSEDSLGNAFELTVRALGRGDIHRLRLNLPLMRDFGTINYFDEQRFGNLTHGQGWIYRELCLGNAGKALGDLLGARSPRDDERHRRFKDGLARDWGDWRECRDHAGRFGAHHSIFEYLAKHDGDFAGAFQHVATRVKLIHLYAWQSHLWNRAVVEYLRKLLPVEERVVIDGGEEGVLLAYRAEPPAALRARRTFPLPGERLEGIEEPEILALFEQVLASEGLQREHMAVTGIPGFALKSEARELFVHPQHLRVRPPEEDNLNPGCAAVRVRFELPRGAYASWVTKRLLYESVGERRERRDSRGPHDGAADAGDAGDGRGERRDGGREPGRDNDRDRGREHGREYGREYGRDGGRGGAGGRRYGGDRARPAPGPFPTPDGPSAPGLGPREPWRRGPNGRPGGRGPGGGGGPRRDDRGYGRGHGGRS